MKKTSERFDRAIKALVKGYMNNTLVKGNCSACAVGNIVAECMNIPVVVGYVDTTDPIPGMQWADVVMTTPFEQILHPEKYEGLAKEEIDATGYSWEEIAKIEYAFETSTKIHWQNYKHYTLAQIDQDQLNGLNAVVDVLCKIEGIIDEQQINEYKELFVKELSL